MLMMLAPSPALGPVDEVATELLAGPHDGELVDATTRSISSSVMSRNGVAELTPAPLTRTSIRPWRSSTRSRSATSDARSVTSHDS